MKNGTAFNTDAKCIKAPPPYYPPITVSEPGSYPGHVTLQRGDPNVWFVSALNGPKTNPVKCLQKRDVSFG